MAIRAEAAGKERILEAARHYFADHAFAEVGISQVLERSKTGAPTLYHHFDDKEGLYVVWAEGAFDRIGEGIQTGLGGQTLRERLAGYALPLLSGLDFDLRQTLRDASRFARPQSQERVFGAYNRAIYEPLVTLLLQAVSGNEVRNEPVASMADAFLGGLLALRNPGAPQGIAAEMASWWCDAFLRAFKPTPR